MSLALFGCPLPPGFAPVHEGPIDYPELHCGAGTVFVFVMVLFVLYLVAQHFGDRDPPAGG